jgi:hypothetical protein
MVLVKFLFPDCSSTEYPITAKTGVTNVNYQVLVGEKLVTALVNQTLPGSRFLLLLRIKNQSRVKSGLREQLVSCIYCWWQLTHMPRAQSEILQSSEKR